jgi:acid phosphatase class B
MKKRVVTIDFDETLATSVNTGWGKSLVPYQAVLDLINKEHKLGSEIHIVSFRSEKDRPEMERFVRMHNLPIKTIVCTNLQSKTPYLLKLGSNLHVDDMEFALDDAREAGIETLHFKEGKFVS